MRYDLKELERARKAADAHAKKLTKRELRQFIERLVDDIYYAIEVHYASGPESSRDEVGFDRSPQRDCRNMRVMPA